MIIVVPNTFVYDTRLASAQDALTNSSTRFD